MERASTNSRSTNAGTTMIERVIRSTIYTVILLAPFLSVWTILLKAIQREVTRNEWIPEDFSKSAFDDQLYQTITEEPYRSFPCMPKRIHISQANNVQEHNNQVSMTVSFALDHHKCAQVQPKVIFGSGIVSTFAPHQSGEENMEKVSFKYASPKTGENYSSDWIYHARLEGLDAGLKSYWYRIIVDQETDWRNQRTGSLLPPLMSSLSLHRFFFLRGSKRRVGETPTFSFLTPPRRFEATSIAFVGDIGQTENSTKTMAHILRARNAPVPHPVSAVVIAGDLSYADAEPNRWERWLDLMEPLLRTTALQTAAGNHEIECDKYTRDVFVPYENFFRNPNRVGPPDMKPIDKWMWSCNGPSQFLGHYNYGNAFYAFVHGLAQIVVLNSYTDTKFGSIQYEWLQNELEAVDRNVTPWLLIVFHCPLHTTFVGHNNEINPRIMLENMEPLFVKHKVNLVISGHDHAYMRTHSMVGSKLDLSGKGPVYLTLGAGGNREQHTRGYIHEVAEPWVAKRDNFEYGYGNLFLANQTHAHLSWVRDGTTTKGVQDDIWLTNQLTYSFAAS